METHDTRPTPPITDPRGWALDHAQRARANAINARTAQHNDIITTYALCAIAEALASLAWTEAHPPRRFPHPVETSVRTVDLIAPDGTGGLA